MSLFAKAKTIEVKPAGKAKATKVEIAMAGVQNLAELDAMIKNLTAVHKTLAGKIKDAGFEEFLKMETKVHPESFKAIDGMASATVIMGKRATTSPLNADELEVLEKLNLTPAKEVVTTEMYGINPVYMADTALMEKVSKAIEKFVPEGFIVHQPEVSKMVVDEALLASAYLIEDADDRRKALDMLTTMALKPKLNEDYDHAKLMENVMAFINPKEEEPTAALEAEGVEIIVKPVAKVRKTAKVAA